jgi:hypothetical protein
MKKNFFKNKFVFQNLENILISLKKEIKSFEFNLQNLILFTVNSG